MQITLYESKNEKVHTEIVAILEFGRLVISGYDRYEPSKELPEGSEYEYETLLDSQSTSELIELLAPEATDEDVLNKVFELFGGERADIRFQAYCLEHEIETYSSSHFDD